MLLLLRIQNFALVDHLDLDLSEGLTILTGETGAGKSIILDAIDAVLGGKVNSRTIRTGADRALVEATFQIDDRLRSWVRSQGIVAPDDSPLICSREITATQSSQRSRSRVNGVVVNKQQMEQLRDRLVEITAQGQTLQIGQPPLQREWLDSYGGEPLLQQRQTVATLWAAFQQASQALDRRRKSEQERLQQLDLFEYQVRELSTANLSDPDELDQLEQERKRLMHSVELQQHSYQVYQMLYENESGSTACADLLGKAEETLQEMVEYDDQLKDILDLVSNALAQVEQAGREINVYGESIEADPQRLQEVQERIVELKQICRKYGPSLAEAIALYQRLQAELDALTGGGQSVEELEQAVQQRRAELTAACAQLTQLRQTAAHNLEERLVNELKPLAMEKVRFLVQIAPTPPSATGADQITFLFSPNPGEPPQPLTEIASGGEMSRFLLALQASFTQIDPVGTLVFDEIDVGVSGKAVQAIAEKLHRLSQRHQVLCVTHQPIVAAMADNHLRVLKEVVGNGLEPTNGQQRSKTSKPMSADVRTVVRVTSLDGQQRREELAQLVGGESAQEAIAFAESLLTQAANLRQGKTLNISAPQDHAPEAKPATVARSKSTRAKNPRST